jgi:hypothetical protein
MDLTDVATSGGSAVLDAISAAQGGDEEGDP